MKATETAVSQWDRMFKVLCIFHRTHDHCRVPPNPRAGSLGHWIAQQRAEFQAGRLTPERIKRLEELGLILTEAEPARTGNGEWAKERWEKSFAQLVAFKERFGHCDVPTHWDEDRCFGHWVSNQRSFRRKGQLSQERINWLDALDFRWEVFLDLNAPLLPYQAGVSARDRMWDAQFADLRKFKKQHGHCSVPKKDGQPGSLHKWVTRQRARARAGQMSVRHRRQLDEIGFDWSGRVMNFVKWDKRLAQLVAFKKKFGHCDVPTHWDEDRCFGHWVSNQRSFRRKGQLSQERIDRLDALGFRWEVFFDRDAPSLSYQAVATARDRMWDAQFADLRKFKKQHGHCSVPKKDGRDGRLHKWVTRQRSKARAGQLPVRHRRQLDEIGFDWEGGVVYLVNWDKRFAQLVAFKKKFGHCDVPMGWAEDRGFAHWVSNQRIFRRKGQLSQDHIDRLDALGIKWKILQGHQAPRRYVSNWVTHADRRWDAMLAKLVKYKKRHGHCHVRKHDKGESTLAEWVIGQRSLARLQRLREDRRQQLDEIGFVWDGQKTRKDQWNRNFAKLEAFKKRFGHCDVPTEWAEDRALGQWVVQQRHKRNHAQIWPDRRDRLEQLGFRWAARLPGNAALPANRAPLKISEKLWELRLAEWLRYRKKHGHDRLARKKPGERSLAVWVSNQRQSFLQGKIPEGRRLRLEQLGFRWKAKNSNWDLWLEQLRAFRQRHGHCRVPTNSADPEQHRLGTWVQSQRHLNRIGRLNAERKCQLDAMGFVWNARRGSSAAKATQV